MSGTLFERLNRNDVMLGSTPSSSTPGSLFIDEDIGNSSISFAYEGQGTSTIMSSPVSGTEADQSLIGTPLSKDDTTLNDMVYVPDSMEVEFDLPFNNFGSAYSALDGDGYTPKLAEYPAEYPKSFFSDDILDNGAYNLYQGGHHDSTNDNEFIDQWMDFGGKSNSKNN